MRKDIQTVFFDLDGTLIDHFTCIYRCYKYAQEKMGGEPVSYEKVRASVGGSVRITMTKLIGEENAERGEALFREYFNEIMLEDLHPLPGAEWLLKELQSRGIKTVVFTNKHGESSRKILAHLGFDQYLDGIIGTYDTPWRKPDPEFTAYALETSEAEADSSILVGDSPYDIQAAHAGGIRSYVVATGSHSIPELEQCDPAPNGVYRDLNHFAEAFLEISPAPAN